MWLGFVFVLISFVHIHGAVFILLERVWGARSKLDVQGQGYEKNSDVDGLGGGMGGLEN